MREWVTKPSNEEFICLSVYAKRFLFSYVIHLHYFYIVIGIQATYERRDEFWNMDATAYYLNEVTRLGNKFICMYIHVYIYIYLYMFIYLYVYMPAWTYIQISTYLFTFIYI
jgi:hypothetical protein